MYLGLIEISEMPESSSVSNTGMLSLFSLVWFETTGSALSLIFGAVFTWGTISDISQ